VVLDDFHILAVLPRRYGIGSDAVIVFRAELYL
jgi:hypothetical protein